MVRIGRARSLDTCTETSAERSAEVRLLGEPVSIGLARRLSGEACRESRVMSYILLLSRCTAEVPHTAETTFDEVGIR